MSGGKLWTEDDDIYLEYYYLCGEKKIRDAAIFLGRTEDAVKARGDFLRKENPKIPKMRFQWSMESEQKLIKLYPHHTAEYIAKVIGTTRHSVLKKAERLGLTGNKLNLIKHLDKKIRKLAAEGLTRSQIADEIGKPYNTVKKYIWQNQIKVTKASVSVGWLDYHKKLNQAHFAETRKIWTRIPGTSTNTPKRQLKQASGLDGNLRSNRMS